MNLVATCERHAFTLQTSGFEEYQPLDEAFEEVGRLGHHGYCGAQVR